MGVVQNDRQTNAYLRRSLGHAKTMVFGPTNANVLGVRRQELLRSTLLANKGLSSKREEMT